MVISLLSNFETSFVVHILGRTVFILKLPLILIEVKHVPSSENNKEPIQQTNAASVQDAGQKENKDIPYNKSRIHTRRQNRDRRYKSGGDIMLEKAMKLAQSGRVEFLDNGVYNVIGDHGTYTVALDHTGKLSCNCPGFIQKGKCSHTTAVMLITKNRRKRH